MYRFPCGVFTHAGNVLPNPALLTPDIERYRCNKNLYLYAPRKGNVIVCPTQSNIFKLS